MRGPRSRPSKNARGSDCVRRTLKRRSTPWGDWCRPWPVACPSAARSSPIHRASSSKSSRLIRATSSGCGYVLCRRRSRRRMRAVPPSVVSRIAPGSRVDTPFVRLAQDVAALTGWSRYGLAFVLGVAAAAMPPVDMAPLLVVAFSGLLWLDEGSATAGASFRVGWMFGFGFFVAGLYWIAAALFVDISRFWWLVPLAAAGLPALFAIYVGLVVLGVRLLVGRFGLAPPARVFLFAVLWTVAEWVRGHALTGLPWNLIGYAWAGGFPGGLAMLQSTAVVGIYGLSFLTVLAAALPALLGTPRQGPMRALRRWAPALAAALVILGPAMLGAIRLATTPTRLTETRLRLVQPSIPQSLKWVPGAADSNFHRLIELSAPPAHRRLNAILWPEAASPYFLGRDQ